MKYNVTQRKETYIIYLGTPKSIFIFKTIPLFCHSSKYFLNTTSLIFIATTEVLQFLASFYKLRKLWEAEVKQFVQCYTTTYKGRSGCKPMHAELLTTPLKQAAFLLMRSSRVSHINEHLVRLITYSFYILD